MGVPTYRVENLTTGETFFGFAEAAYYNDICRTAFSSAMSKQKPTEFPWDVCLGGYRWRVHLYRGEKIPPRSQRRYPPLVQEIVTAYEKAGGSVRERILQAAIATRNTPFCVAVALKYHGFRDVTEAIKEELYRYTRRKARV